MGIIEELLKDIPLPKMVKIKQTFNDEKLDNVDEVLQEALQQERIRETVKPGMEIAVAVGSRGVDQIVEITARTIKFSTRTWRNTIYCPKYGQSWRSIC